MVEAAAERATNWGRWGAEDERGALNLLTPDVIQRAGACIRRGKVYSLGLPIHQTATPATGYRNPPLRLTLTNGHEFGRFGPGGKESGVAEDFLVMSSHSGTHMDAPHVITGTEIEECTRTQGVELRPGDALLIRTGWTYLHHHDREKHRTPQPGIGLDAARFIRQADIAVVGADNNVEAIPFDGGQFLSVHRELIWKLGIPFLELLDLEQLAADRVYECLFMVAPLKVAGGLGSPINPLAVA
jgi:kynurenine formamidase